jgi:hypothetical protein
MKAQTAVIGKRFVVITGNRTSGPLVQATQSNDTTEGGVYQVGHASADGVAVGVAAWDAAIGELVPVISEGIIPITGGAAIVAGAIVGADAAGKVKTVVTATTKVLGVCMTACSGVDVDAEIKLTLANVAQGT